ncbi:MAG: molecular chaperone Skp [Negativicutes bacterium]|nr:molecular chaperone Skp [Negativicutes bacterium]
MLLLVAAAAIALAAGCSGKPAADTKPPAASDVGIIDMNKAIKSHPKFTELDRLNREFNTLAAQAERQPAGSRPEGVAGGSLSLQGLNDSLAQEFNARMADKQAELNKRLEAKANQHRQELAAAMKAHAAEVDKQYQPQIFSLQLKLKTVQLTKEEADKLQKELEKLQQERADKLSAQEQELARRLEALMAPEQKAAEQEMAAYAQELNNKAQATIAAKQAEAAGRASQPPLAQTSSLERQALLKQQEVQALEAYIIHDIKDKTAKTAAERKLSIVLAGVRANISAVDITDAVIVEIKK